MGFRFPQSSLIKAPAYAKKVRGKRNHKATEKTSVFGLLKKMKMGLSVLFQITSEKNLCLYSM
jgi:hypothetical protein